jgi:hypothetical protein
MYLSVTSVRKASESMKEFTIKHDFMKSQPKWIGDYPRIFGRHNEGVKVLAESAEKALKEFAKANNRNPWYLTVEG